jgi:Xaa-Pro aminopeptidase
MWREGLDYKCGTGHGIGYFLNVHESPPSIRWRVFPGRQDKALAPGMIVSDEPGVYLEGRYGIRIETILLTVPKMETEDGKFLGFEPLTFVPLDPELIDPKYLTPKTRDLLNAYHKEVYEKITPLLPTEEERAWLKEQCKEI